jgi:DNA mismatch repair ATPase MutS
VIYETEISRITHQANDIFTKKQDDGSIDLGEFHAEQARSLLSDALYELYRALTAVAGALYEVFHGLSRELDFYTTAVKFCNYLDAKELHYQFPEFAAGAYAENVYDPLLLVEGLTKTQIVTNGVRLSGRVLIRGANAAGKTSFIRALGLLHIFAAAGLPVCAENVTLPFFDQVLTQFSKSEQLGKLDEAGRFEQEVKELAEIYGEVGDSTLVLLNETFQTTAYAEGADALRYILDAIEKRGASWIFVTHLTPLLNDPPDGAKIITMENYSYGD